MQGTLYSWAKETEPAQAASINTLVHGVAEGATADALRFFDMDKSYILRILRCVAFECSCSACMQSNKM